MIGFTLDEILLSVLYALIYGVIFCAVYSSFVLVKSLILEFFRAISQSLNFDKILPLPQIAINANKKPNGALFDFFSILLFFIGYVLISYFSLDGVMRIYMLVLSFASFYLSKITFFDILLKIIGFVACNVFRFLCFILRVLFFPLKCFFGYIRKKV